MSERDAREVIELAAACVRPNARRRKSADIIARALKQIAQDEVDEAGNVVTLMRLADKACGTARDQSGELPRFDLLDRKGFDVRRRSLRLLEAGVAEGVARRRVALGGGAEVARLALAVEAVVAALLG